MPTTRTRPAKRIRAVGLAIATLVSAAALTLAQAAPADVIGPAFVLGPTTVAGGVAVVSGSIGATSSNATVTVNGRNMDVDSTGNFAGTVDLGGQSSLTVSVYNPATGRTSTTTIPVQTDVLGVGLVPPTVLDHLEQAAVDLIEPAGGFVTEGLPITVGGSVGDPDQLSSLTLNGQDALGQLDADRSFTVQVPGTLKEFHLTATDRQGTIQTLSVPVGTATAGARTVSAADAVGLRIAKVRYVVTGVKRTKRFRMVVTVRDRRGLLVRGATVRVRGSKTRLLRNPRAKKTGNAGNATFVLQ